MSYNIFNILREIIYFTCACGLHEISLRRGYGKKTRITWCALGFYFGLYVVPIGLLCLRKRKVLQ